MLLDALEASLETPLQATVCVIGSGPSGLVLTRRLVEAGVSVVVLEAGPLEEPRRGAEPPIPVEYAGQPKRLDPTTAQQVGGTSSLWHGLLAPLDAIDFEPRPWIADSGWPIGPDELAPFYEQAAIRLGVDDPRYFDAEALPLDLKSLLAEMPFERSVLTNKMLIQPTPVRRFRDDARGYLAGTRHARLVYRARVVELLPPEASDSLIAEVVYLAPDNRSRRVHADHVVLSGGAYQNPRLLLNSRARWAAGIGNGQDLVGRYLADHPMGNLFQVRVQRPVKAHIYADFVYHPGQKIKTALRLTDAQQQLLELPNHAFYLRPSFAEGIDNRTEQTKLSLLTLRRNNFNLADAVRVLSNLNVIMQIVVYQWSLNPTYRLADLFFVCEQVPNRDSRVTLAERIGPDGYPIARADWRLSSPDHESAAAIYDVLVERGLGRASFQPVHRRDQLGWGERLSSAAHHLGTCRMAAAPSAGVVDRNLKVFGIENLYIADGSVFPTTGSANSTLTAAALALRLGDHLTARIGRPPATLRSASPRPLTVAVTGASGFIGGHCVARCSESWAEVRAIGRRAPAASGAGNLRAIGCALDDVAGLTAALAGCDALVHLAYAPGDERFNLRAFRALLAAAAKAGVTRVVLVSTISVYDAGHRGPLIEEDAAARTYDDYSIAKLQLEREFERKVVDKGLSGIVLQPTIVYGWPGGWTCNAADVAKYRVARLPAAGRRWCNAVYVDDVAAALQRAVAIPAAALAKEGPAPRFLISGPKVVTWAEFYTRHAAMLERLGLAQSLDLQPLASSRRYHDDSKRDRAYRLLLHGVSGRLARPMVALARQALRRDRVGSDRVAAALRRVTAPCREAAWRSDGLSRSIHAARFEVHCERAARVLGYRPRFDLAAGIAATEAEIAAALRAAVPQSRPEPARRVLCK